MLEKAEEYAKMAAVEGRFWWYRCLHNLVERKCDQLQVPLDAHIVDAGCGTGGLLDSLRNFGYRNVEGFDLSPYALTYCEDRGLHVNQYSIDSVKERHGEESVDVFIANDVFCYLSKKEQVDVGMQIGKCLKINGLAFVNLPAFEAFAGIHDLSVSIKQRFRKADIDTIFNKERFTVLEYIYWPWLLSPCIFIARALQRMRLKFGSTNFQSDIGLPHPLLNKLYYQVTEFENRFIPFKPFGSSLFIVAKKIG